MVDSEVPLYGLDPGWLKACTNFRVMPGGYLEARLGFEEIKPSSGTASDPIAAGIFTGAHEHSMADGYVFTAGTAGAVFSSNLAQRAYFDIWPVAATTQTNDAIYFGADQKFSRVILYIGQGTMGASNPTFAYEYPTASDWSATAALTTTSTPTFSSTGEQVLEFADPGSAWVRSVRNGVYGYFVRIRMSAENDGFTTKCTQSTQKVYCDWTGTRQIYVSGANAAAATNNGVLKYYGQSSATQVAWNSVSTALFSGGYARNRFASYRNILYFVNGKDQKRWDNHTLSDMGFTAPSLSASGAAAAAAGDLGTGVWLYAMTLGYGPAGEWGESGYTAIGSAVSTTDGANETVDLTWTFGSTPASGIADVIYIYRTPDLSSVPTGARSSVPYYRIKTLTRDSAGTLPTSTSDATLAFPFPPVDLNIATVTPPTRCKFITTHKNRLFLGNNNQFAGRVWWSEPFQVEAFNTDENFADFTRSTGGQVTGMAEFNDQVVVFTEDQMFGIANVDQDVPSIYVIHPGIGCVAPDSVQVGFGVMCWMARNGVYVWDGNDPPKRVSDRVSFFFGKMSFEKHGGSRCLLHNRLYDIYLIDAANSESASPRFRYDLVTGTWAQVSLGASAKWAPLAIVTAPVGHANAGVRHPLYGQAALAASDFTALLGEYTTQDDGSNYTATVTVHFGPAGLRELSIDSVYCFYGAETGWGTPSLSNPNTSNYIGSVLGTLTNMTVDGGPDYSRLKGVPTEGTLGTADIDITFSVATSSNGGTQGQKLLAMGIEGTGVDTIWGNS